MVKVPEYTPNVTVRPAFRQNIDVRADAESFGAAAGRGLSKLAEGLGDFATSAFRVQALDDTTRAKEADTNFAKWKMDRMYGENGYMLTEGRNAVEGREAFEKELEEKRKEFGAGLTPGASRHYDSASNARVLSGMQTAIVHSANGRKKWVGDASNARVEMFGNEAMSNANDPAHVDKNIAAGILELREQGNLHGWGADTLKLKEMAFQSGVHKNIAARLAETDPLKAGEYLKLHGGKLTGADKLTIDKLLDAPLKRATISRDADAILGGAPTSADPQPPAGSQSLGDPGAKPPAAAAPGKSPLAVPGKASTTGNEVPSPDDPARDQGRSAVPGLSPTVRPDRRGNYSPVSIASGLMGLNENRDPGAISSFIKRYAGIEIDPRKTPWCSGIANGILGANGIKGTGSLAARSFLNFGTATDNPRIGDVVVLSRGNNPSQGHVGFFNGFDDNGNVKVLGGNQSNQFSEATFNRNNVLSFRRPTQANGDNPPPNQTVAGLQHIEGEIAKTDPSRQAALRSEIGARIEFREKMQRVEREHTQKSAEQWMIANPGASPDKLPLDVRQKLGVSGMNTLYEWQKKVIERGQPQTDPKVKYDLQTLYADDPDIFGEMNLFSFRDRLSDGDWKEVNSWRETARRDGRKAREEGSKLGAAFSQAKEQLEAAGVVKPASKMKDADHQRVAVFQNSLAEEIEAFKRDNKKNPSPMEVQSIINRMLLPVVIKSPGAIFGTNSKDARLFETRNRPDGSTVEVNVKYTDIPIDIRRTIASNLERQMGRKPSPAEVTTRYEAFVTQRREPITVPIGQSGFDD